METSKRLPGKEQWRESKGQKEGRRQKVEVASYGSRRGPAWSRNSSWRDGAGQRAPAPARGQDADADRHSVRCSTAKAKNEKPPVDDYDDEDNNALGMWEVAFQLAEADPTGESLQH